jgi:hypothetical protein
VCLQNLNIYNKNVYDKKLHHAIFRILSAAKCRMTKRSYVCRQQNPKNSILMTSETKQRQPGLNCVIFYHYIFLITKR